MKQQQKIIIIILLAVSVISFGCINSKSNLESENSIKENVISQIDILVEILNNKRSCGDLTLIMNREEEGLDFSDGTHLAGSFLVKYTPDFLMGKFIEMDCEEFVSDIESDFADLNDISYKVQDFNISDSKDEYKANIFITIRGSKAGKEIEFNKTYIFKKYKDEWLIYDSY